MKTPIITLFFLLFSQFMFSQLLINLEVPKTEKEKLEIAKKDKQKLAQKEQEAKLKREQAIARQKQREEQARREAIESAEKERRNDEIRKRDEELAQKKFEEGKIALKNGNYEYASALFKESYQSNSEIGNKGRELLKSKIKQMIEIDKNDCELINLLISYTEIIKKDNNDLLTLKCK